MAAPQAQIQPAPAVLVSFRGHQLPAKLYVAELFFDVPLDHRVPDGETIRLFARAAFRYERPLVPASQESVVSSGSGGGGGGGGEAVGMRMLNEKPWLVYLEGGPGMGNREPQDYSHVRPLLNRGYQLLFLDYRGTGLSTAVTAAGLQRRHPDDAEAQAAYLRLFRADSIVRDLEAVRRCLTAELPPGRRPWSLLGQSFGGFVSLTYLSHYGAGLREVFLTGGLAPVGQPPDAVYRATYATALRRNAAYFAKYPEDAAALRAVARHLQGLPGGRQALPGGGWLTVQRLLTLGYMFGFHGGLDAAHALVLRLRADLEGTGAGAGSGAGAGAGGTLTRPTLVAVEQYCPLDVAPLYAVLHEAIYCERRGVASRWAAQRVGAALPAFAWLRDDGQPLSEAALAAIGAAPAEGGLALSSEMIYPFMFDTFPELMPLKAAAERLAAYSDWDGALYDAAQLAANRVPVYAASFVDDLYVDFALARETAARIGNLRVFETNMLYHNALRARADEVLAQLFRLRDDTVD